jgi:hypothetical protein
MDGYLVLCYCCLDNTVNLIPICCFNIWRKLLDTIMPRAIVKEGTTLPPRTAPAAVKSIAVLVLGTPTGE